MDQRGHMIDQKGLKMYEKSQKMEFSDREYLLIPAKPFLKGSLREAFKNYLADFVR